MPEIVDIDVLTSDLPTLLGVTSGIAVLAGLICLVLHLFSKTKYPRPRHFGDANLAPPILFSSDTGKLIDVSLDCVKTILVLPHKDKEVNLCL